MLIPNAGGVWTEVKDPAAGDGASNLQRPKGRGI